MVYEQMFTPLTRQ